MTDERAVEHALLRSKHRLQFLDAEPEVRTKHAIIGWHKDYSKPNYGKPSLCACGATDCPLVSK